MFIFSNKQNYLQHVLSEQDIRPRLRQEHVLQLSPLGKVCPMGICFPLKLQAKMKFQWYSHYEMDAFTVIKKVTSTFLENLQIPHKHLPKYSRQSLAEVKLSSNLSVFGAFIYASKVNGVFFLGGGHWLTNLVSLIL